MAQMCTFFHIYINQEMSNLNLCRSDVAVVVLAKNVLALKVRREIAREQPNSRVRLYIVPIIRSLGFKLGQIIF